jgi:hypothetical protein
MPRMTENIVLDTTIHEPAMAAGEVEMLRFALDRARAQFAWKCGGLDAAGLSRPHPPSAMTLGGLLKHLALVEDQRTAVFLTGEPMGPPWDAVDFEADPDWAWRSAADDSPAELSRLWREAVERSRAATARVLADGGSTSRRSSPPPPASTQPPPGPGRPDRGVHPPHRPRRPAPRGRRRAGGRGPAPALMSVRSSSARPDDGGRPGPR